MFSLSIILITYKFLYETATDNVLELYIDSSRSFLIKEYSLDLIAFEIIFSSIYTKDNNEEFFSSKYFIAK